MYGGDGELGIGGGGEKESEKLTRTSFWPKKVGRWRWKKLFEFHFLFYFLLTGEKKSAHLATQNLNKKKEKEKNNRRTIFNVALV